MPFYYCTKVLKRKVVEYLSVVKANIPPGKTDQKEGISICWKHPGGKLRRLGASSCTETELLAIILGTGTKGRPAEKIARDILDEYKYLPGLMGISMNEIMKIKGLKEVKATQLAAVFEIARRIVKHLESE